MLKLKLYVPTKDRNGLDLPVSYQRTTLLDATDLVRNLGGTGGTVYKGEGFWFGDYDTIVENVKVVETLLDVHELTADQLEMIYVWARDLRGFANQESVLFTIEPTHLKMHFVDAR